MQEFQPIKEGKVREIYDNGDSLIMVATDRISAFDVILKNKVTNKGKVLTQMSKFWFDYTRDVLPNHMLSVDTKDMPEFFQQPQFEGKCMKCRKLTMLPIEMLVSQCTKALDVLFYLRQLRIEGGNFVFTTKADNGPQQIIT